MGKKKDRQFEDSPAVQHEEDQAALVAIDEGIRDAKAGRTVSLERVRELLPQWITASFSRKER